MFKNGGPTGQGKGKGDNGQGPCGDPEGHGGGSYFLQFRIDTDRAPHMDRVPEPHGRPRPWSPSTQTGPGRRGEIYPWDMTFLPLTFAQFVHLVKPELFSESHQLSSPPLAHFRKLFTDYLLCGGFPVTINEYLSKGYIATELYEIFTAWIEGGGFHAKDERYRDPVETGRKLTYRHIPALCLPQSTPFVTGTDLA